MLIGPCDEGQLPASYGRAFERLGHQVVRFDSDRAYTGAAWYAGNRWLRRLRRPALWNRVNEMTLQAVGQVLPDLVLAFKAAYMRPETVAETRARAGVPVLNYYPDNPYCGVPLDPRRTSAQRRDLLDVLRCYDRVYAWERGLVQRLQTDGVAARYVPFGVDAELFRPRRPRRCRRCRRVHDVVFVGAHRPKRARHLECIRRHRVGLWGKGWHGRPSGGRHPVHRERAFGAACAAIYSGAAVSLNILDDLNMPGHNMRTFEIPASGGVMLATFTEEQARFFPEGRAAWYYRDPGELDDLLDRLLADRRLRERTRQEALRLARRHDYARRASAILADAKAREAA
jgi:hypothetical protein